MDTGNTNKKNVKRRLEREMAFILIFELAFTDEPMRDIIDRAVESRELEPYEYTVRAALGVYDNLSMIDEAISLFSKDWRIDRISKVALALLRLSLFEIMFLPDEIPGSVSVNEAVELAKIYGTKDDPVFVNGVLGGYMRRA